MYSTTSSGFNIFAFVANSALYFLLSILASPATTTKIALSPALFLKDKVLAILAGITFAAWAANSTVALDWSNSKISSSLPYSAKYSLTFSIDIFTPLYLVFSLIV